jgi:hypothetical protein
MPGQTVTIVQQVFNLDGYRADGYDFSSSGLDGAPVIARVINPDFSLNTAFPAVMNKLDTGLYVLSFVLPSGAAAVGTYIVDGYWYHPTTLALQQTITEVVVNAPFGLYSVTAGG